MEKVHAEMVVDITGNSHKNKYHFGEEWNFTVDRFSFSKINETSLKVSFDFEAPIVKRENGKLFIDCPSEFMEEFQKFEEEVERILDLISLETSVALKIRPESYSFFSSSVRDNHFQNERLLELKDIEGLKKRFNFVNFKLEKKNIINALRSYRLLRENTDAGDRGLKIYSSIEQLFGKGERKKLLSGEEYAVFKECLSKCENIPENKKRKIFDTVKEIRAKSINEIIAENMDLTSNDGVVPLEDKAELLRGLKCRHAQAHGEIVPKREFDTEFTLAETENIIEYVLRNSVVPKMKVYFLFKENTIQEPFAKNHGQLIDDLSNEYLALCIRDDELQIYEEQIPREIINQDDFVFVVAYNEVKKISKTGIEVVDVNLLKENERKIVEELQSRLNNIK